MTNSTARSDSDLQGHTPGPWYVSLVEDRPTSGMWHCGPNAAWVEVTHLPTMISARAFGKSHHKAKQAAMNCCQMMIEESGVVACQFPERIKHPADDSELLVAARDALQALVGVDRLLHEHGMMSGVECPAIAPLRAAITKARGSA